MMFHPTRVLLLALAGLASLATTSPTTTTTLTSADGTRYFVPHVEVARISNYKSASALTPFAVVSAGGDIEEQLTSFKIKDDVYSDFFSKVIYIQGASCGSSYNTSAIGAESILPSSRFRASAKLPVGPYFLSSEGSVYRAYRLYDDPYTAFTAGLIPIGDDSFEEVSAASFTGQAEAAIPVPSRLYFEPSESKPLAGVRVGVKDIYHVKGVKTGAASRDFYALYPPRNESGPALQKLVDLGAVIVGKTKTSQFANGENPTADWVEVLAPFNPRGDGWQYCSSSSAGSGVAVAAYDWVDAAVGTDTSGSMRFPAAYNGVFAGRQSHGGITTDGVVPVSTTLDTLGVFTRSAETHAYFVKHWFGEDRYTSYSKFPKKIYRAVNSTTGGFPVNTDVAQAVYDAFIPKLAAFLGASVTDLDPSAAWLESGPERGQQLLDYTYMKYLAIAWWEQVKLVRAPFFADWAAATQSAATPRLGPKARASFDYGMNNVTAQSYQEALDIKATFTSWWSEVVNPSDAETCSEYLYVYPTGAKGDAKYRDTYLDPPNVVVNWQISHAAVYAGLPDYAVPIGQVEYLSRLTNVNETLPISISIGAGRGCDWMLSKLFSELEAAGITSSVKTGEVAF